MTDAISTSLAGLNKSIQKIDNAAQNVARGTSVNNETSVSGDINLIKDIVDISIAKTEYKANIKVLKSSLELTDELLNILDEEV